MNKILYYNNCWFTNVGEAFIDIGAFTMIKRIFGADMITAAASSMSYYYMTNKRYGRIERALRKIFPLPFRYANAQHLKAACNLLDLYDADYFILAGMFACNEFLNAISSVNMMKLCERGIKVIFLGLGGSHYTQKEIDNFRKYLEKMKPVLVVTRDYPTYLNYKDYVECISGIDCAFWCIDSFDTRGMARRDYDVIAFNRSREPEEYSNWPRMAIRPKHFQYSFTPPLLSKITDNIMISDSPYDYLSMYANACNVYTDLVHATVTSLQYGVPVKFFPTDGRAQLFDSVKGLYKDNDGFLRVKASELSEQKNDLLYRIRTIIQTL